MTYDQLRRREPEMVDAIRIVWRSPLIPADPLVRRADLPPELKMRIADFFFGHGQADPGKPAAALAEGGRKVAELERLNGKIGSGQ